MQTAYLLPLTVLALLLAVAALGFRAGKRQGYGPFVLGVAAAAGLVIGKFAVDSDPTVYGSIAALVGASLWNSWPKKASRPLPRKRFFNSGASKRRMNMATKRKIEVFSAGCPACQDTVALVQRVACPSCDVSVLDMNDPKVANRAKGLGIRSVPAVVIDGKLADCCTGRGPEEATLRAAGLGQAI